MELRHLLYFQRVAELEHITQTADELMIAQPALSKIIKTLEEELEAPLFDRHGKNITLNDNGRILYKYVKEALSLLNKAKAEIAVNTKQKNSIIISFNSASMLIPLLASQYHKINPDLRIQFANHFSAQTSETLCIFDSYFKKPSSSESLILLKENCVLAFSERHRFSKMKKILPADLSCETFLYSQNCHSIYDMTVALSKSYGFETPTIMECVSNETVFSFIEENLGIALIPSITWNLNRHPAVKTYQLTGCDTFRELHMEWKNPIRNNPFAQSFQKFCITFFNNIQNIAKTKSLFEDGGLPHLNET